MLRIFIGWDPRETDAYKVCEHSLRKHATLPLMIEPLVQDQLRAQGLYRRPPQEPAATAFTYTRFFVPYLCRFEGTALFCDCDFLFTRDIARLFAVADPGRAVQVVQHDYTPRQQTKMDGQAQVAYPRKNWSSLILWNCSQNNALDLNWLNTATPAQLHRFAWLADEQIGALSPTWNWLEGEYDLPSEPPAGIHYTNGGPWFKGCREVHYGALWEAALAEACLRGPTISEPYRALNRQLHETNPGYGTTAQQHAARVAVTATEIGAETILDYGSGKGLLRLLLGERYEVRSYEPAFGDPPPLPADLVVCLDVLEHVEPELLENVLRHLRALTKKAAYVSVCCRPAAKVLADGRNAHRIIQPPAQWEQDLLRHFTIIQRRPSDTDQAVQYVLV